MKELVIKLSLKRGVDSGELFSRPDFGFDFTIVLCCNTCNPLLVLFYCSDYEASRTPF